MEFTFRSKGDKKEVLGLLSRRYQVRFGKPVKIERELFDTFDWRLYASGMKLEEVRENGITFTEWREREGEALLGRMEGPVARLRPAKTGGPQWVRLGHALKHRALLPLITLRVNARLADLSDRRGKVIARLATEAVTVLDRKGGQSRELPPVLRLKAVKGYEGEFQALVEALEEMPGLVKTAGSTLDLAFEASGLTPLDYSSKINVRLEPGMPTEEAVRKIFQRLAATMEKNRQGAILSLDTEFLHDFRVAVRRTRSGLGQMKASIPPSIESRFRASFGGLGQITGPTRDLDVYLIKFDEYAAPLSDRAKLNLEPLRVHLAARQKEEQGKLARALSGGRYKATMERWEEALGRPWKARSADWEGRRPVGETAGRRILKLHRKVLKLGASLTDDSPPAAVHQLRIACKKLRYMIEFFKSLYDDAETGELVERLKVLQDTLGDFQDFEVHRLELYKFADEMWKMKTATPGTLLSMGELAESLAERQRKARAVLGERFAGFASEECTARMTAVFRSGPERIVSNESSGHLQH